MTRPLQTRPERHLHAVPQPIEEPAEAKLSLPNRLPMWARRTLGLAAVTGVAGGASFGAVKGLEGAKSGSVKPNAEIMQRLESLPEHNPNVVSVQPDLNHPGLEQVTYRFSKEHGLVSDIAVALSPDQSNERAYDNIESYNGGSEITHPGDTITVDVDTSTGLIVNNPDSPTSAEG